MCPLPYIYIFNFFFFFLFFSVKASESLINFCGYQKQNKTKAKAIEGHYPDQPGANGFASACCSPRRCTGFSVHHFECVLFSQPCRPCLSPCSACPLPFKIMSQRQMVNGGGPSFPSKRSFFILGKAACLKNSPEQNNVNLKRKP